MRTLQLQLLRACWSKKIPRTFEAIREYAYRYKKYKSITQEEIKEVLTELLDFKN